MWALLALRASDVHDDSRAAMLKKARVWLGEKTSGQSTEWWATRLMLERCDGSADKADVLRAELLKRQRADGGWGWLCDDDSDALGTGIALYALRQDKMSAASPEIAKARQFLIKTQTGDGSWPVRGTKQNKKDHIEPTTTFWGTCWAVIGLCETLTTGDAK
jgi:squalene-hopene/tetraprenyl-beta-curcumene cyclase